MLKRLLTLSEAVFLTIFMMPGRSSATIIFFYIFPDLGLPTKAGGRLIEVSVKVWEWGLLKPLTARSWLPIG